MFHIFSTYWTWHFTRNTFQFVYLSMRFFFEFECFFVENEKIYTVSIFFSVGIGGTAFVFRRLKRLSER